MKESQLRSLIERAITEELSARLDEGLGRALGNALVNTAKGAALGVVAPSLLVQKGLGKMHNIINGPDTIAGTVSDFFGGRGGQNGAAANGQARGGAASDREVKRTYGEPETEGGLGKKLERKRPVIVQNFLGSGREVNFGRHYHERFQDDEKSVWNRKLADAEAKLGTARRPERRERYIRQYQKQLKDWLDERDKAYEAYIMGKR